jgi:methylated-DNA-[protein]-cysteine S-methyltransferase
MKKTIIQSTPFGPVVVLWSSIRRRAKVTRIILSRPGLPAVRKASTLFPDVGVSTCPVIDAVCSDIVATLNGKRIRFSLGLAQLDLCPPFQQAVLRAEHGIPCGSVSTYRLLAMHLGKPAAARAVGNALATNPFPIIIPCHRAIRSDRALGGYQGGLTMKRALLEGEGVRFGADGRVLMDSMHYDVDPKRGTISRRRPPQGAA